jgi:hypothetical protein
MITSLSAILGIALAIMLIGFELIYRTFSNYVRNIFFGNSQFRELAILYLATILIGSVTLGILDNSVRSNNLMVLVFFQFILCLGILFPHTKSVIFAVVSTETISKLVESLKRKYGRMGRSNSPELLADYLDSVENDPLFILGEAASNYIKNDNVIRAYTIIVEVTKKLLELAKKEDYPRDLFEQYLSFYNTITRQSFRTGNFQVIRVVFDMMESIHDFCAENSIQWDQMIELDEFIENLTKNCIRKNLEDISQHSLYMIPRIFEKHIRNNVPREADVWDLNLEDKQPPEKIDHNIAIQWQHVSSDYGHMQSKLTQEAIKYDMNETITCGIHGFSSMASAVLSAANLGDEQKRRTLMTISFEAKRLLLESSKKNYWLKMVKISPFDSFSITRCIDQKKAYSNILLVGCGKLQLELLSTNVLPIYELNDLGTAGRHCIHEIKKANDIYEQSTYYIVNVFSKMRVMLEKKLDTVENKELYLGVYSQLESLERWKGKKSKKLQKYISDHLKRFSKHDKIQKDLETSEVVWPK